MRSSPWTATRAFTLDRVAPNLPTLQSPATGVLLNAVDLSSPDYNYYYEYQGKYSRYYQEDPPTTEDDGQEQPKAVSGNV